MVAGLLEAPVAQLPAGLGDTGRPPALEERQQRGAGLLPGRVRRAEQRGGLLVVVVGDGQHGGDLEDLGQAPRSVEPVEQAQRLSRTGTGVPHVTQTPRSGGEGEFGPGDALRFPGLAQQPERRPAVVFGLREVAAGDLHHGQEQVRPAHQPRIVGLQRGRQRLAQRLDRGVRVPEQQGAEAQVLQRAHQPRQVAVAPRQALGLGAGEPGTLRVPLDHREQSQPVQGPYAAFGGGVPVGPQRPFEPDASLGVAPLEVPEGREGPGQADRAVDVVGGQQPFEGGTQIVVLGLEPVRPHRLVRAAEPFPRLLGEVVEVRGVLRGQRAQPAPPPQPGEPVGAQRLQQPVAGGGVHGHDRHQRLVDEPQEQVGRAGGAGLLRGDGLHGVQGEGTGEHRQPLEQLPFGLAEQVVAPLDDAVQRPVAAQRGPGLPGQEPEPVVEPAAELLRVERVRPCRGQFDGQRQTVQLPADLRHRRRVRLGDREARRDRRGPVHEQPDRVVLQDIGPGGLGGRRGEPRDRPEGLTGDAESLPARRHDP